MTVILPFRRVEMLENVVDSCIVQNMNDEPEEWRQIAEFPNYSVSNLGRIRRDAPPPKKGGSICIPGKILKLQIVNGYPRAYLFNDKFRKNPAGRFVHRLAALAFLGPPPTPQHDAAHEDGNPANPRLANISWKTKKENQSDRYRHGTHCSGERNKSAKLNETQVTEIRNARSSGALLEDLGREYGCTKENISCICSRKTWSHVA